MTNLKRSLFLAALLLISSFVSANVDDVSKDLEVTASFPSGKSVVSIGEQSSIFLSAHNKGQTKATVHNIVGALYNQKDSKQPIIRNLTASRTRISIAPGARANLTYKFKVELEPRDIGFIVNLDWYTEEDTGIRTVGYKGLLTIKSNDSLFDLQSISLYLLLIGIFGGGGYYVYTNYIVASKNKSKSKKVKAAPVVKNAAEIAADDNDWIPDHVKKAQAASESASRSPKTVKKRN
ncbi:hypothetical protein HK096_005992 [Nowakowskiella sp. JEL0078]|nr:hypothetical protein HK096_005992 [Nowakowskiella sp. JEL0078]